MAGAGAVDALTDELVGLARARGAAAAGVASATPFFEARAALRAGRESGRSGPLGFTYRRPEISTDVRRSFPWARSILVAALDYGCSVPAPASSGGLIARFAATDHYRSLRALLGAVALRLRALGYQAEVLVDDNRLVDRAAAVRAGVGWQGRNTMVLSPGHGPWLLLGSVVTDAPLRPTGEMRRSCGACTACLPACPTAALDRGGLDARRCLSTWLQTPGSIPQWIRPRLGRRIYGCDSCLEACPPGRRSLERAPKEPAEAPLASLLEMSDGELLDRFSHWFVPRRHGRYIRRNLLVAAGNEGGHGARDQVLRHASHPSSMIRGHAYWALARGYGDGERLRIAESQETAPEARDELSLALLMLDRPDVHRAILEADEWARGEARPVALALSREDLVVTAFHQGDDPPRWLPPGVELRREWGQGPAPDLVPVYDPGRFLDRLRRGAQPRAGSGLSRQRP